ncbi:hypothetical protein MHU86_18461 [Fragilaria crotonensis]|nr:hypothetical protein MHU86_18461 [Fragilaria crotonensis]
MNDSPRPPPWPPDPPAPGLLTAGTGSPRKRKAVALTDAERTHGKLAMSYATELRTKGWRQLVTEPRGLSNIAPTANHIPHKAARLLGHLGKRGVGVTMHTPPWSVD